MSVRADQRDSEVQVVVLPGILPALETWLESRGLELFGPFPLEDDDLPTYGIGPKRD